MLAVIAWLNVKQEGVFKISNHGYRGRELTCIARVDHFTLAISAEGQKIKCLKWTAKDILSAMTFQQTHYVLKYNSSIHPAYLCVFYDLYDSLILLCPNVQWLHI